MDYSDVHWFVVLYTLMNYAASKQLDLVMGLDTSVKTEEFALQKKFFQNITKDLYSMERSLSIRVGVFGYSDTIQLTSQKTLWPPRNMSESDADDVIDKLDNANKSNRTYLDDALRFALASFDDDRTKNRERECSEKVLMLVVTEYEDKWSSGRSDLQRLQTIGVKTIFMAIGTESTKSDLLKSEETLHVSTFNELSSFRNGSDLLQNIAIEGIGSCCDRTMDGSYLEQTTCSNHMGSRCEITCDRFLVMPSVVLATCEPNGVWSLGKNKACSDFEFHLTTFLIGIGSSISLLILVTVIVTLIYKKKCRTTKMSITPTMQSSCRSIRNQYSASSSQKVVLEQEVADSEDDTENTENDSVVYDYAEEKIMTNLSKRTVNYKIGNPQKEFERNNTNPPLFSQNVNTTTNTTHSVRNIADQGYVLPDINVPQPCVGRNGHGYTEEDIYVNEETEYEDDEQIYINT